MFGISNNIRSREVRECTPELFWKAVRSPLVADICAQIADGLEKVRRGEMVKEDYETLKAGLKKRLPIFTPHATFRNGRRLNADAVPSGLSMYDIDHLPNPREYWGMKSEELRMKNVLRFVVLAHITPSTEGLRLFFIIPDGMDLAGAQKWMSEQLGDANYDQSVKDLARSSFVVPEDYIIYVDEERLFKNEELKMKNEESPCHAGLSDDNRRGVSHTPECVTPLRRWLSRGFHTPTSLPVGLRLRAANRCRESATTSCIGWLRIYATLRIITRKFFYRLCHVTGFRRKK